MLHVFLRHRQWLFQCLEYITDFPKGVVPKTRQFVLIHREDGECVIRGDNAARMIIKYNVECEIHRGNAERVILKDNVDCLIHGDNADRVTQR